MRWRVEKGDVLGWTPTLCVYTTKYFVYMISHVHIDFLTIPYGLLNPSDLLYENTPYVFNAVYINFYGLLWLYTT